MNTVKALKTMKKFKKRINKELESNTISKEFEFAVLDDIYWYFQFTIQDGLYKTQTHIIQVKLVYGSDSETYVYPMNAPMCSFVTPIWHPNVSVKGTICLDVLKDNWSPSMFTGTIISALKVLLLNPEPSSAQNMDAALMMNKEPDKYKKYINEFYDYNKAPSNIRELLR
jgi:ubiquitin-protein ligase